MNITEVTIIGEIVAKDYRAAKVFKIHNIDFCCNGNRTIGEACSEKNLNVDELISELKQELEKSNETMTDFSAWPLDLLADYIEKTHHRYVESKITEIKSYLEKIVKVHDKRHPELFEIQSIFNHSAGELAMHMKKEELVLFPRIRKMVESKISNAEMPPAHFGTVQNPIAMMMSEHDNEGENFRKISELSKHYIAPENACNTYRVTFSLLKEFEEDLHKHIHLENNILFPKAIKLEKELT